MTLYNKTVLIVEDDDIARNVLEHILRKYFAKVFSAPDGRAGLQIFEEVDPDIIITDLAMPVLDGFLMIKKLEEKFSRSKVLIVTAYRDEAEQCGDYNILYKPIERKELVNTVCGMLGLEPPA